MCCQHNETLTWLRGRGWHPSQYSVNLLLKIHSLPGSERGGLGEVGGGVGGRGWHHCQYSVNLLFKKLSLIGSGRRGGVGEGLASKLVFF